MPVRRHSNLMSVLCAAICGLAGCAYGNGANAIDDEIDGGSGEPIPHGDGYRRTSGYLSNAALPDSSSHSPSLRQPARLQTGRAADKPPPSTVYEILYNGQYPSRRESGYSEGLQGIASTSSDWYFMQELRIWKFPVGHDLNRRVTEPNPAVGILRSFKLGESGTPSLLQRNGYNHFGDGDVHGGKLYVPVEGDPDEPPALAVFDAGTLAYLDGVLLPMQTRAGWCAVEPVTGRLYTSNNHVDAGDPIFIYDIRWQNNNLTLVPAGSLELRKPDGSRQNIAEYVQGGDFSDDGSTLFLANGKAHDFDEDDGGLWAFDTVSGMRLHRSSQTGDFKYEFHPGIKFEEPEGLTFQTTSAIVSPGIPHSDLHAILLDNDFAKGREDSFWLKHYIVNDDDGIQLPPADLVAKRITLTIGTPASTAMDAQIADIGCQRRVAQ